MDDDNDDNENSLYAHFIILFQDLTKISSCDGEKLFDFKLL
jgi:hypothetical protein